MAHWLAIGCWSLGVLLAAWLAISPAPVLLPAGLALAAAAPLAFATWHRHRSVRRLDGQPIAVSGLSGLGCVMILVAIQRFGAQWQWVAGAALACLIAWLLWQRRERQTRPHA
jgi:hypothetical protein